MAMLCLMLSCDQDLMCCFLSEVTTKALWISRALRSLVTSGLSTEMQKWTRHWRIWPSRIIGGQCLKGRMPNFWRRQRLGCQILRTKVKRLRATNIHFREKEMLPLPETTQREPRIIRVTDMSLFVPLLSIADGVASSAGSQLISECIYSGTPILSLYRANDDEQMLNVMIYRYLIANGKEKDPNGIGKLVHGISHEEFSDAFSFLALDGLQPMSERVKVDSTNGATSKILTKEQEFLLLRKSRSEEGVPRILMILLMQSRVPQSAHRTTKRPGSVMIERE